MAAVDKAGYGWAHSSAQINCDFGYSIPPKKKTSIRTQRFDI